MDQKKGKVIFIGAGPGDPELITIKAYHYLQMADIVLADRLVSPELLKKYIPSTTKVLLVGKQCRKGASTPQETINEMLIFHALQGKLVVRLKGGDVSVFSNILDELEILVKHQLTYEIVPGITAALGAAAYAGIPLTARGYATSVRWLTSYHNDLITLEEWKELSMTDDTLVFYMSGETVLQVVRQLTQHQIAENKLLDNLEQDTTPHQRVHIYNLYEFEKKFSGNITSPALLIIGKVVALHHQFKWIKEEKRHIGYFDDMQGMLLEAKPSNAINLLTA